MYKLQYTSRKYVNCAYLIAGIFIMAGATEEEMVDYDKLEQLDEDIVKILTLPCQNEGEVLVKKVMDFARILSTAKEKLRCHNSRSILAAAINIYRRGKPAFLMSVFSSDTLCQTFKWSQQEVELFYYAYHDCQQLWNNFETIYKAKL